MAVADQVKEIFGAMPANLNADAAKGMSSVIQFNLSGDGGGNYHVVIKDGACSVNEGSHASPNMTMTMAAQDYVDMITGKLNGQMAFMSGKLKIAGDMGLAMKMQSLFKRPA
ncbi:MAG: SCP2 sterol-binding domain-containing protein [Deltaproteobacteria bacterium]|nr:SCP2 sterol-binding domain-containing protein [Deltaproteobacteria bacterium]